MINPLNSKDEEDYSFDQQQLVNPFDTAQK
jgi:hypothetical protein